MGLIKFSENEFLGAQELNKFQQSLDNNGFRKLLLQDSISFGVVNNSINGNFTNFLVQQGTAVGSIKVATDSYAIDSNGQIIKRLAFDNFPLINDNQYYYAVISYVTSPIEAGKVSVDGSGNLTGDGSIDFTTLLRGNTNIPSRVMFSGSTLNLGEYDLQEIISPTSAILSGVFQAETNLGLIVVGSFTPDAVPTVAQKQPFQYDSSLFTLRLETVLNTPPTLISGLEFVVARVRRNGSTLNIEDKRSLNIYKDKAEYKITTVVDTPNPLIGIEAIKYNELRSTRNENLCYIAWSFRSNNWTINTNTNTVTLNGGNGGKYKSTNDFNNGDFNGWRLYAKDGSHSIIQASSKSGTQINLVVSYLEPSKFTDATAYLNVTPDNENIELYFSNDVTDDNRLAQKKVTYPINTVFAVVPLIAYGTPTCSYGFRYRYKTLNSFGTYQAMPSDLISGYLNEASFDSTGEVIGTSRTTYTGSLTASFITVTEASNSYKNVISGLSPGDVIGVTTYSLLNGSPVYSLQVGVQKQTQVFTGSLTFSVDQYINIKTAGATQGNIFYLDFRGAYTPGIYNLRINQDFINVGTPGTNLLTFSSFDYTSSTGANLFIKFIYDGTNWLREKVSSLLFTPDAPLGFIPVQQGGGTSMLTNKVYIGWSTSTGLLAQVDSTPQGRIMCIPMLDGITIWQNGGGTVEVKAGSIGNTQLAVGAAVANLGFTPANVAQPGWTNITLINGWAAGVRTPQYRIDTLGLVHLRGDLNGAASSNVIFTSTLPNAALTSVFFPKYRVSSSVQYNYETIISSGSGSASITDQSSIQAGGYALVRLDECNYWSV